ncbi:DUF3325 domain-containing protein [Nitrosomonas sp.]|uniref:DUF3325 domain-containing protein n=1 Tax=Nitrosomonas sp. TaxID=42353 RepID=UPI0037C52387
MPVSLAALAAFAFAYAGMTGLSLTMPRHHEQVTGQRVLPSGRRHFFKILGWLLLILAIVPCIQAWGAAVGVVVWFGFLTAGGLLIILMLPYIPRLAVCAAAGAGIIGVLMLFIT